MGVAKRDSDRPEPSQKFLFSKLIDKRWQIKKENFSTAEIKLNLATNKHD